MASLLVVIELVGERAHPASLEALGLARRLASTLGATVYAAVPCVDPPGYGDNDLIAVLSRHGADKVLLVTASVHGGPLRWGGHGPALMSACNLVHPMFVLIAGTQGGRDLTARLASRLGAGCLVDAAVEVDDESVLQLREGAGPGARRLDGEIDFTVVLQLSPGRYEPAGGDEEAEVEMLDPPSPERDFDEPSEVEPAPVAVVLGEAGASLARALDAAGAASAAPLAFAVDDEAVEALLSDRAGATRVALGRGAGSCTHAHYALVGDAAKLAETLAEALAVPAPTAPTETA